jgi:soluble lytic murein transglycosylase-like protein
MTRKRLLICLACWLWLVPCLSFAGPTTRYDLTFKHWSEFYFPWEDWHWFKSQGQAESGVDQSARSHCGAVGIMQLMPSTASDMKINLYDPEQNIRGGILYDRDMWRFWQKIKVAAERRSFMFGSYNAGPGNIRKAWAAAGADTWGAVVQKLPSVTGNHSAETIGYVKRIGNYFLQMR